MRTTPPRATRPEPASRTTATSAAAQLGSNWRAGAPLDLGHGALDRQRLAVDAVLDHRVERVAHGDHPGAERDRRAAEAVGVAAAVPPLVARADERHQVGEVGDGLEDARADVRVLLHARHLLGAQRAGLAEDRLGDADLADVVQQRAQADDPRLAGRDAQPLADGAGQLGDLAGVVVGVRILGLERGGQRAEGGEVRLLQPLGHPRPGDHRAGLAGQGRAQADLARLEPAPPLVVDLDQPERLAVDVQPQHQQRAVAELDQQPHLGRLGVAGGAHVGRAGVDDAGGAREVAQRMLLGGPLPAVRRPRVARRSR